MKLKRSNYRLCYHHILIFLLSYLWNGTDSELVPGYTINVSRRVTVQRGLCVHIPCKFILPEKLTRNALGIWYKIGTGFAVAQKRKTQEWTNGRFFLVGEVWRGDCSLYIEDPSYGDKGEYGFRVEDNIRFSYLDIRPYVEVTEFKNKPEISPIKSWLDGEKVTLNCTFPGTCDKTTPKLTWQADIRRVELQVTNNANDANHISTITFTARKEQNNAILSCIVQLKGRLSTKQQFTLKVEYPPRAPEIKCFISNKEPSTLPSSNCIMDIGNTIYSLEGSKITLICSADSIPKSSLVWKYPNQSQILSSMDKLSFTNVSLSHEGFYICQAKNAHGTKETSVTLKITYKPRMVNGELLNCRKVENGYECNCLVQSFPIANVQWKMNGKSVNSSNTKVNILTVTPDSVTNSTLTLPDDMKESPNISCVASNKHGELVQEVLMEIAKSMPNSFPVASILGGVFAAVLILIGVLLVIFYIRRRMTQDEEILKQTNVNTANPIYCNSDFISTGLHDVGQAPTTDHKPNPGAGSEYQNSEDLQYMSVSFSKLKAKVSTEGKEEEVEYSVIKHRD